MRKLTSLFCILFIFFSFAGFSSIPYGPLSCKAFGDLNDTTWVLLTTVTVSNSTQIYIQNDLDANLEISSMTDAVKTVEDMYFAGVHRAQTIWHQGGRETEYFIYGKYVSGAAATTGSVCFSYARRP